MAHRLLVIDDDEGVRKSLCTVLQGLGMKVEAAEGSSAAFKSIAKRKPDLVLLDLNLAEEDGMAVLRELHAWEPELPVIMISAQCDERRFREAMLLGARDIFLKPLDFDELDESISAVLTGS
jgi:two-component system response regulator HydG